MSRFAPLAAMLIACAPLAALPAYAADAPAAAPATVDAFEDIYAAIRIGRYERQLDQLSATIAEQIASADTSGHCRGTLSGAVEAMVAGFEPVWQATRPRAGQLSPAHDRRVT